ncbi:MAG: hypothetical protein IJ877_06835 [Candidatus Gastranaerophilales bacterium]|nr:hypothetical protein [Candidatus Gastranaerophilales bacterium]
MKNFLKIIIVNILLILGIFLVYDWGLVAYNQYKPLPVDINFALAPTYRFESYLPYDEAKRPIVTMGCSFVYGEAINENETLAYKLQQYTNRKTYNYGTSAHGIQHVLYKLKNSPVFTPELNPEYIVYVFIGDHLKRMYTNYFRLYDRAKYLKYAKAEGGGLKEDSFNVVLGDYFKVTYTGKKLNDFLYKIKPQDPQFDLFKLYLKEIKNTLNEKYPDTKFVIVVYNSEENSRTVGLKPFHTNRWDELEDEGFIVINFDSLEYDFLNKQEFLAIDRQHPAPLVWDILVPIISKRLNLL